MRIAAPPPLGLCPSLRWFIVDRDGQRLGCLLFETASRQLPDRDKRVGWSKRDRERRLHQVLNNTRFWCFPEYGWRICPSGLWAWRWPLWHRNESIATIAVRSSCFLWVPALARCSKCALHPRTAMIPWRRLTTGSPVTGITISRGLYWLDTRVPVDFSVNGSALILCSESRTIVQKSSRHSSKVNTRRPLPPTLFHRRIVQGLQADHCGGRVPWLHRARSAAGTPDPLYLISITRLLSAPDDMLNPS